ncbi:MAG: hypothetical protein H6624_15625 [Bdellovibrionaceae bacterium]|nr:hypothetical protein [Pseudobdellovibrionaceae bacterium]
MNDTQSIDIDWKVCSAGDKRRLLAIKALLASFPGFLLFLFNKEKPELRADAKSLKKFAQSFSSGEQVLINIAIDIWNGEGGIHFNDIYEILDTKNFIAVLKSLDILRGESLHKELRTLKLFEALIDQADAKSNVKSS